MPEDQEIPQEAVGQALDKRKGAAVENERFRTSRKERIMYFLNLPFSISNPDDIRPGSLHERLSELISTPTYDRVIPPLEQELKNRAGLTEEQLQKNMQDSTPDTIPLAQREKIAEIIAQSNLPLRDSWSEEELLFELSLATGLEVDNLDQSTAYQFDGVSPYIEGDSQYRLLNIRGHADGIGDTFLTVMVTPRSATHPSQVERNYRLNYNSGYSGGKLDVDRFRENVDRFYGDKASQQIRPVYPPVNS